MDIDAQCLAVDDLREKNALLRLKEAPGQIGGLGWLAEAQDVPDIPVLQRQALRNILTASCLGSWQAVLLAGHASWQPDNRITRRAKLWASLKELPLPNGLRLPEVELTCEKGIKFFSAVACDSIDEALVIDLLRRQPAFALSLTATLTDIEALIKSGWEPRRDPFPSPQLVNFACSNEFILGHHLGAFDDRAAGFVIIARPEILRSINSRH